MAEDSFIQNAEIINIQLEIMSQDEEDPDPALVSLITEELAQDLSKAGYSLRPIYTGKKSGSIFEVVTQLAQNAIDQKDLLIILFGAAKPIVEHLIKIQNQQAIKGKDKAAQIETSLELNGAEISIEPADLQSEKDLAEKFQKSNPEQARTVTSQSKIKLKGKVTKPPRRKKH